MYNKNKGILNDNIETLSGIPQTKERTPLDAEGIIPEIIKRTPGVRINTLDIKNIFDKVPIIKKKLWG